MTGYGYCCALTLAAAMTFTLILPSCIIPGWIVLHRSLTSEEVDIQYAMNIFMPRELQQATGEGPMYDDVMPVNEDEIEEIDQMPEGDDLVGDSDDVNDGVQDGHPGDWQPGMMDWEVRYPDGESVPVQSGDEGGPHPHHRPHDHPHRGSHHHSRQHPHHHGHHGSSSSDHSDMDELTGGRPDHCCRKMSHWAANRFGMAEVINGSAMRDVRMEAEYGLWVSRYCIMIHDEADMLDTAPKQGTDACVIVDTNCALRYAAIFDSSVSPWTPMPADLDRLSHGHMGGASLKEHRIESATGLFFCLIGFIAGGCIFRKFRTTRGCPRMKPVCALAMLIGMTLILIPSVRFAKYSHHKHEARDGVDVDMPYSVIGALIGCVFAFATFLLVIVGVVKKQCRESVGKWYQFNNEAASDITGYVKKPGIVFLAEPLPEKAGLYDVTDFDYMKLVEQSGELPENEAVA